MNYIDLLKNSSDKFSSIVCLGLDPMVEDIPLSGTPGERIENFYKEILNALIQKKVYPAAVKPNHAFYAQYGIEGITALKTVISIFKSEGFPVILDVKRGDIGKTAGAYARESFEFFSADAVTLAPYMGYDSIEPFISDFPGKGYYIITKTSNKSSVDIQDMIIGHNPLYIHVAEKILQWYTPGIGSVVGATYPEQIKKISDVFMQSGKEIPLLIPGIGSQGGSLEDVMSILRKFKDIRIHRINSSSAINYAYKQYPRLNFAEASVHALRLLNDSIRL